MGHIKKIRVHERKTMHKRKLRSKSMNNNEYEQSAFISNGFNINSPETIERIKEANKAFPA